jgi:tRNA 5-methylaminomethyl-2-thiouridine biosynthesis bifunctional protein
MNSPDNKVSSPAYWRDSETLKSAQFDDVYFNTLGGLDESNYVFIEPNLTPERLISAENTPLTIIELGLGTGLNLLLTIAKQENIKAGSASNLDDTPKFRPIHYIAIEKYPLQTADIQKALMLFPELKKYSQIWLNNYPTLTRTITEFKLATDFQVTIIPYDIHQSLDHCIKQNICVDAIYLDGFSPAKNPDMWSLTIMKKLAKLSHSGTTFSSFSSAGLVRRNLQQAGFNVCKQSGFGKKREMIYGHYTGRKHNQGIEPWLIQNRSSEEHQLIKEHIIQRPALEGTNNRQQDESSAQKSGRKVIILGAGFAGITTALKLLARGLDVTLVEKNEVASGASGNDAGLAYPVIDRHLSDMTQFSFNAFQHLTREFKTHWQGLTGINPSTIELLPQGKANDELLYKAFENSHLTELLTKDSNNNLQENHSATQDLQTKREVETNSVYIDAFLVKPKILCAELIELCRQHDGFRLFEQAGESTIKTDSAINKVVVTNDKIQAEVFDDLVLANAFDAQKFDNYLAIGTDKKYGQVTSFNSILNHPISMKHYFVPINSSSVLVGANYLKQPPKPEEIEQTGQNYISSFCDYMNRRTNATTNDKAQVPQVMQHRVSARMTTIDRYPIIGQLPDYAQNEALYHDIGKGFRPEKLPKPVFKPNIWLNIGYGSKGFTHASWGAEVLADMMMQNSCRTFNLDKVNPLRHLIRKLKKPSH